MTRIQWTEETWNPVTGCTRVSAGCDHCYASALHNRRFRANWQVAFAHTHRAPVDIDACRREGIKLPFPDTYDTPFRVVRCHPERLERPLRWRKPRLVFVNSMSDLFHQAVPADFVDQVFAVMARCPQHQFQVLTKRMREYMSARWPLPNVWLGVSVEDQQMIAQKMERLNIDMGCFVPRSLLVVTLGNSWDEVMKRDHVVTHIITADEFRPLKVKA